jgi:hypothetical protein
MQIRPTPTQITYFHLLHHGDYCPEQDPGMCVYYDDKILNSVILLLPLFFALGG